ncbi:MAG: hypothetical protein ACK54C_02005 [Betaproteobacteria bacterium]
MLPSPTIEPTIAPTIAPNVAASLLADGASAYEGEAALLAFATLFAPVMAREGNKGDYACFRVMQAAWRRGYDAARGNVRDADAIEKLVPSDKSLDAFERRMKAARSEDALGAARLQGDIPRSQAQDAQRKAASRALPDGTPEQWTARAAELIASGKVDEAATAATNAKRLREAADKAAKGKAREELSALKNEAREALRDLLATDDAKAIKAALAALRKATPKKAAALAATL